MHFDLTDVLAADATVNELLRPLLKFLDASAAAVVGDVGAGKRR